MRHSGSARRGRAASALLGLAALIAVPSVAAWGWNHLAVSRPLASAQHDSTWGPARTRAEATAAAEAGDFMAPLSVPELRDSLRRAGSMPRVVGHFKHYVRPGTLVLSLAPAPRDTGTASTLFALRGTLAGAAALHRAGSRFESVEFVRHGRVVLRMSGSAFDSLGAAVIASRRPDGDAPLRPVVLLGSNVVRMDSAASVLPGEATNLIAALERLGRSLAVMSYWASGTGVVDTTTTR